MLVNIIESRNKVVSTKTQEMRFLFLYIYLSLVNILEHVYDDVIINLYKQVFCFNTVHISPKKKDVSFFNINCIFRNDILNNSTFKKLISITCLFVIRNFRTKNKKIFNSYFKEK